MSEANEYLEFCKALTDGFIEALDDEGIEVLYQNYLLLNSSKSNISKQTFAARELRGSVVNQLMQSEYAEYFASLEIPEMAELLQVPVKKLNADWSLIQRKLSALRLKESRATLEDMRDMMEEINYVSETSTPEAPNE